MQPNLHPLDTPAYKRRSVNQNSFYWGCVIWTLCRELKFLDSPLSPYAMHTLLKALLLDKETVCEDTGEIFEAMKSTRKLNTKQFGEYILKIQQWAAEKFQIYIPDPNEITEA